jgi:hypothetical protein
MRKVFISYRSLDSRAASALENAIRSAGADVYLDRRDPELETISVGAAEQRQPVMQSIRAGLESADTLAAIVSRLARGSWWVPAEIVLALDKGKEVVAICETDVRPPDFQIHHFIRNEGELRQWLGGLGIGTLDEGALEQLRSELFKPASEELRAASLAAVDRIHALWSASTWKELELEDPGYAYRGAWIGCRSATLTSTLHAIAVPVYLYSRATRLDRQELERVVGAALYDSWIDDEGIAAVQPSLVYEARKCTDWRALRDANPARYWLQGMKPKDLEKLFAQLSSGDGAVLSKEAFEELYVDVAGGSGSAQRPLGLAANPLQGFTLETRPVFARLMAVHLRIHAALLRLDSAGGVWRFSLEELFGLPASSPVHGTESDVPSLMFLQQHVGPRVRPMLWA